LESIALREQNKTTKPWGLDTMKRIEHQEIENKRLTKETSRGKSPAPNNSIINASSQSSGIEPKFYQHVKVGVISFIESSTKPLT